jgi:hypothetical protein
MQPFDLAMVDRLLTTTRSVRKRLDPTRPVAPETIADVAQVALVPVAHVVGDDLQPGPRRPVAEFLSWGAAGARRS